MQDVVIIGGGAVGCAVARELSRWQLDVCLVEQGEDVCVGTSKANSAIVHAGFDAPVGSLKARFNVEGSRRMEALSRELDFSYRRNGALVLCFEEAGLPRLEELMRIPDPYIHLDVDYNARETRAEGEIGLFFQIRDLFAIGFAFGIPALKWLLRWKKEKKLREAAAQAEQAQTVQKTEETDGAKTPENDKKG